jgi:hypothetical protein
LLHINFVTYKRLNYKLCYSTHEKLAAETFQDLATLFYPTGMCTIHCTVFVYISVSCTNLPQILRLLPSLLIYIHTVKKASQNSDVENGGANQTTWGSENSYSNVVWFCATVVNIGIWCIPTWLFLQCIYSI